MKNLHSALLVVMKVDVNWLASLTKNVLVPALEDEAESVYNSTQVNHSLLNDIEQYQRNDLMSSIVHTLRNHIGITKTFLD